MQVQQALQHRFGPHLTVHFTTYPPSPLNVVLARLVGFLQFATIGLALVGETAAQSLGIAVPQEYLQLLQQKRMMIIFGSWFVGNMIHNGLTATGAFEVFYDGQLVHSKLATNAMPTMAQLLEGVQAIRDAKGS